MYLSHHLHALSARFQAVHCVYFAFQSKEITLNLQAEWLFQAAWPMFAPNSIDSLH
jgi:hypothetical protein